MTDTEIVTVVSEPTIVHQGRYRLWKKPDGGLHLVYQREDKDEPDHMEIPGMMIALFERASSGNMSPMALMGELIKLRNEHLCCARAAWPCRRAGRQYRD